MKKDNKPILQHIADFLAYLDIERGLSNKSQETYGRFLKKFVAWLSDHHLENLLPHQLNEEIIRKYRIYLSQTDKKYTQQKLKRSTQNYYLIALRNLLNYFADRDILSLPSDKIKLAKSKSNDRSIKFLGLEQIKKLLEAPDVSLSTGIRDRAILETFFSTGLRVAELVSLNREQFQITSDTKDLEVVIIGKGGRSRPVYFSERAMKWLKVYLEKRVDKEKALFIRFKGPTRTQGKRLTSRSMENIVKKYALLSGMPSSTTCHTLRHSFATDLLSQGVDLRAIQEFLGHKSIGTTQIYASITSKQLRDTHRKFHSLTE
jgi:site-specific recombinase XerD